MTIVIYLIALLLFYLFEYNLIVSFQEKRNFNSLRDSISFLVLRGESIAYLEERTHNSWDVAVALVDREILEILHAADPVHWQSVLLVLL